MLDIFEDREDLCLAYALIDALRVIGIILFEAQMFEILQARAEIMDGKNPGVTNDLEFVRRFAFAHDCTVRTARLASIDEVLGSISDSVQVVCRIYDPEGRPHTVSPQYNHEGWVCVVDGSRGYSMYRTARFNAMLVRRAQESPFNAIIITRLE